MIEATACSNVMLCNARRAFACARGEPAKCV